MLVVRDKEAGNIMEEVSTVEEGVKVIEKFEAEDQENGVYENSFYEVAFVEEATGKRVLNLRKLIGLSQAKFAARYGIPIRMFHDWENGTVEAPEYAVNILERLVWEDKENIGLRWCICDDRGTELFVTPAESKAEALERADREWDRFTDVDKKHVKAFFVGLMCCNDENETAGDVCTIAKRWR